MDIHLHNYIRACNYNVYVCIMKHQVTSQRTLLWLPFCLLNKVWWCILTHTHTLQLVIQYGYYRESFVTCPHVKDSDSCASVTLNLQYPYSCISPLLHTRGITLIQNSISPAIVLPDHEKINEICRQILVLCWQSLISTHKLNCIKSIENFV